MLGTDQLYPCPALMSITEHLLCLTVQGVFSMPHRGPKLWPETHC